jgi:hypothetical protein
VRGGEAGGSSPNRPLSPSAVQLPAVELVVLVTLPPFGFRLAMYEVGSVRGLGKLSMFNVAPVKLRSENLAGRSPHSTPPPGNVGSVGSPDAEHLLRPGSS